MQFTYETLSPHQKTFLEMYPPTHAFAVVSWGCAATSWLARTLNSHPDIYCVHTANGFWSALGDGTYVDGAEYLRLIASQGHAHKAAGDVHGVDRHAIPAIKAEFGEKFSCAIVVREPIARLHSQVALFKRWESLQPWNLDYVDHLIETQLTLPDRSYGNRMFVHGVCMLNTIIEETAIAPIYRSEDLTSNHHILCQFVDHISQGKVEVDLDWSMSCVVHGKVNSHKSSIQVPSQFADWQLDVVRKIVQPQAWELYQELGYPIPEFL